LGADEDFAVGIAVAVPLAPWVLRMLMRPLRQAGVADPEAFLKVMNIADGFSVAMKIMLWSGLLISLPGMIVAIAWFVFPALTLSLRRLRRLHASHR